MSSLSCHISVSQLSCPNDKDDLITSVDAEGVPTQYSYDEMHRVIEVSRAGQVIQYTYDSNGNLASTTTPNLATFEETSNKINYPNTFKSPLGFTKFYTYTPERELASITLPSSKTITYTYLKEHLATQITSETSTSYTYGCGGLLTEVHTDHGENISYSYDDLKRVTTISYTGSLNQTLNYSHYHPLHNLPQSITYAGTTQTLSYDKDALLTQAGDYTLNRDTDSGQVTSIADNSYSKNFTYNDYGELNIKEESHNNQKLHSYEILNRTLSGKIASKVEQVSTNEELLYQYTYDIAGRLTEVKTNGQTTEQYKYDHNGNRLEATVNNTTTKAYYTIEDQLEVYGQNTYRYDDDGYLTEKTTPQGTTTYTYGTLGELLEVITPTKTITYKHNANNQRVAKFIDGTVVEKYLWADLTTLLAVYDGNDTLKQRFEYANNRMPVAMTDTNNIKYYLHYDQVGSLRAITDDSHNIVKEITYNTFGNVLTDTNPTLKVPFGFAGGLYDEDTKLTRFGYRDYDAYVGKWTTKDPIGFQGGDSNLYGYVLGDPVRGFDPSGLLDYNGIDWNDHIKNTNYGFFDPLKALIPNALLNLHGGLYNSNCYTVMEHGYQGAVMFDLNQIANNALNSGKECIELIVCEIGQGNGPKDLNDLSGLPVKYSEDYVMPPAYGIGSPTLSNSSTAKTHGWQWAK